MKKYISTIIATAMAGSLLCACASGNSLTENSANSAVSGDATVSDNGADNASGDTMSIVTTIFPEYDWVMNVLGDNASKAEVTMLLDNGVDLHSYQPTADDILKISTCDLFIYVGGESDEWVEDALLEATNKDMVVIDLLDVLGESVKEEEVVEGMQEEDEHDHDEDSDHDEDAEHDEDADHDEDAEHDEDADHDEDTDHDEATDHDEGSGHEHEEGEVEYDEHVWLSLKNASVLVQSIADALETIDPDNADTYKTNASTYIDSLNALDAHYEEAVNSATYNTVLFGDRFPFRYLVDDYGLDYYAAFVGCSAETEASFETITFLSQKVDELGLPAVLTIEGNDHRIAETIVGNTSSGDQQILTMDSMQSTTSKDVENGASYLSIMEDNLDVLTKALS